MEPSLNLQIAALITKFMIRGVENIYYRNKKL